MYMIPRVFNSVALLAVLIGGLLTVLGVTDALVVLVAGVIFLLFANLMFLVINALTRSNIYVKQSWEA